MTKRILALILCLALCVTLIPAAFAEGIGDVEIVEEETLPPEEAAEIEIAPPVEAEEPAAEPVGDGAIEAPSDEIAVVDEPAVAPTPAADEIQATVASGSCGDSLTWTLYDYGGLVIEGSGAMNDYTRGTAPWYEYRDQITELRISDTSSITKIGSYAFYNCTKMKLSTNDWVCLPSALTSIGEAAFLSCTSLSYVCIPENVSSVGQQAFGYCYGLRHATVRGAPSLGYMAFGDCRSLEGISFLGGVPNFSSGTFSSLYESNAVSATAWYPPDNSSWTSSVRQNYGGTLSWTAGYHGWAGDDISWTFDTSTGALSLTGTGVIKYTSNSSHSYYAIQSKILSITIGEGITGVGQSAFFYLQKAASLYLPSTLTSIGNSAFGSNTSLTSVTIPAAVTKIYAGAFSYCNALKEIRFMGHAPEIEDSVFKNVYAKAYYYPVYTWTSDKLQDYGGALSWSKDDKIGDDVRWELSSGGTLWISGNGATLNYNSGYPGFYWFRSEVTNIYVDQGVTRLGNYLLYGMSTVTRVWIASTVTEIGTRAFSNCGELTILFDGAAPSFGSNVFAYTDLVLIPYYAGDTGWSSLAGSGYGADHMVWVAVYYGATGDGYLYSSIFSYDKDQEQLKFWAYCKDDKALTAAKKNSDGSYTRLDLASHANQYGYYTVNLKEISLTKLAIVYKGDVNLDGVLRGSDGTMLKRAVLGSYHYPEDLKALCELVADLNGDGTIKGSEGTQIARAVLGTFTIPW